MHKENDILQKSLSAFSKETGLQIEVEKHHADFKKMIDKLLIALKNKNDYLKLTLHIEKNSKKLLSLNKGTQDLIVTDYVNPNLAETLKKAHVNFLDTVGNVYLNAPPFYIYVVGNKAPKLAIPPSAFSTSGIKLIFLFLCCPNMLNASYRDIAAQADVGLGTITNTLKDLKEKGYLIQRGKLGRKLRNSENLIEEWVKAYNERLRKKLIIGTYQTANLNFWKKLRNIKILLGGEAGAAKLTSYLKPEIISLYISEKTALIPLANKLQNAAKGNVEVLEKFWNFKDEWSDKGIIPPLLVYADLIGTNDPRNLETAKIIYEKEIIKYIKNN